MGKREDFHKRNIRKSSCEKKHNDKRACEKNNNMTSNCDLFRNYVTTCEKNNMRLNRAIAATGLCSRRNADALILSGQIAVNGIIETNPGRCVSPADQLALNGRLLAQAQPRLTLLLNKPVQTICTAHDPQGRKTVLDLLPESLRKLRLYPVGRLDYFSEGLLILTNDGDLAQCLAHPSSHIAKVYEVIIRGHFPEGARKSFESGLLLPEGKQLRPVHVKSALLKDGNTLLHLELHEGFNRQIRKMCDVYGLTILRLKRIRQGPLELGSLQPGQFRQLQEKELARLSAECFPSASKTSGAARRRVSRCGKRASIKN